MKDNITVLTISDPENASLFVVEALYYFAAELKRSQEPIGRLHHLAESFRKMANLYLDWEEGELQRIMARIDAIDQREWNERYPSPVDWDAIESEILKGGETIE